MAEQFEKLERRIEDVVELVVRLRDEKAELVRRLTDEQQKRRAAAARIDALLDKVETMT